MKRLTTIMHVSVQWKSRYDGVSLALTSNERKEPSILFSKIRCLLFYKQSVQFVCSFTYYISKLTGEYRGTLHIIGDDHRLVFQNIILKKVNSTSVEKRKGRKEIIV